ncbi:MAG: SagB/ThcOx family dehydrogenase, partial [Oscillospiraceae bacterium]|nr:SagB/ThcOx family dehydrogenase [Oscillospiraceae bacterium]
KIKLGRDFCKSPFGEEREPSDQQKRLPQPPLAKAPVSDSIIPLTDDFSAVMTETDFFTILGERSSQRFYKDEPISLDQLAFLLYSCQGVKSIRGNHYATLRTVPSGGARHAFEMYLAVRKVEGLEPAVYHYLPLQHALEKVGELPEPEAQITKAMHDQKFAGGCAVCFLMSFVPYRAEWRYSTTAHRVVLIDAGHVFQNLYLACGACGCGTCAIAAIDQPVADELCGLDGEEEFIIYAAPVGLMDAEKNAEVNAKLYAKTIEESNAVKPLEK